MGGGRGWAWVFVGGAWVEGTACFKKLVHLNFVMTVLSKEAHGPEWGSRESGGTSPSLLKQCCDSLSKIWARCFCCDSEYKDLPSDTHI